MQYKDLNAYRITHYNGTVELLNAESMEQALNHMELPESDSNVVQCVRTQTNIRTLVDEIPDEVQFNCVCINDADPDDENNVGGSIATPSQGIMHIGDVVQLKAIADKGFKFTHWTRNDEFISRREDLSYTMQPLIEGESVAVFTAHFKLAPVEWKVQTVTEEAFNDGCTGFPLEGKTEVDGELELIAYNAKGYRFWKWERNGVVISHNHLLRTTVDALAEGEGEAVYQVFFLDENEPPKQDEIDDPDSDLNKDKVQPDVAVDDKDKQDDLDAVL